MAARTHRSCLSRYGGKIVCMDAFQGEGHDARAVLGMPKHLYAGDLLDLGKKTSSERAFVLAQSLKANACKVSLCAAFVRRTAHQSACRTAPDSAA